MKSTYSGFGGDLYHPDRCTVIWSFIQKPLSWTWRQEIREVITHAFFQRWQDKKVGYSVRKLKQHYVIHACFSLIHHVVLWYLLVYATDIQMSECSINTPLWLCVIAPDSLIPHQKHCCLLAFPSILSESIEEHRVAHHTVTADQPQRLLLPLNLKKSSMMF